jgi:adenylate cyclase
MLEGWSADRLASVTGEPVERLAWYAEAGLLLRERDGYAADSLHRVRLIHYANQRGISDEELALATKEQGDLIGVLEPLTPLGSATHDLVAAAVEVGVPEELFEELQELLAVEDVHAGSDDDVEALRLLGQALSLGLPREALLQLLRVFADTTDRLADASVRIFHDYVHEPFRVDGLSGRELIEATDAVAKPALALVEPAVLYFHRRAWQKANRDDFLRHLAEATTPPAAAPGESTATVLFVDLAGFTPLTVTLGDQGVAEVLRLFASMVRALANEHGGRIIKQIGDAFMLVFDRAPDAVRFGLDLRGRAAEHTDCPGLHLGAHYGPLLHREGDYFGNAVNLAARVTSASGHDQFLITSALHEGTAEVARAEFTELPPRTLKGLGEPVVLFEVRA